VAEEQSFFSRWSRRKVAARVDVAAPDVSGPAPVPNALVLPAQAAVVDTAIPLPSALAPAPGTGERAGVRGSPPAMERPPQEPPPPTLADVAELTTSSDYTRFVARDVAPDVRNAALKKLFTDPHYNVMDGLDTYIDDYNTPDPLPPGMLRQMVQSQMLGLFDDEKPEAPSDLPHLPDGTALPADTAPALPALPDPEPTEPAPDEDTDLQLQPDHDAGRAGAGPGAGQDAAGQH